MGFHWMRSGKQALREMSITICQEHSVSDSRSLHITGATGSFSVLLGVGKNYFRTLIFFSFCLHERVLYIGDGVGEILCIGGSVTKK